MLRPLVLAVACLAMAPAVARGGCTASDELGDFRRALHRELACGPVDRWLAVEGCEPGPTIPACASGSLEQLTELVLVDAVDRLLADWGYGAARCRIAIARGAELYLEDRLEELGRGRRTTRAGSRLDEVERLCDGQAASLRAPIGGACAEVAEPRSELDGALLRHCLRAALERVAQELSSSPIRPNIVLILTDDQRWDTLEVMPLTRDLLARRGLDFRQGFVTTSVCCPDRATILTGQYAHNHGVLGNEGALDFDASDTLPLWLQGAGYRTAIFGKYMNNTGRALGSAVPPGWHEWQVFVENRDLYLDYPLNENGRIVRYGDAPSDYSTDLLARRLAEFVEANVEHPFFALFAPFAPHPVAVPAPRHAGAFAELAPWRPPSWRESDLSGKPGWVQRQRQIATEKPVLDPVELVDQTRIAQLESLLAVDEAVKLVSETLERLGLTDNTLVVFTSDNGYLWNEHWLLTKNHPYEESIRVPLLVRYPLLSPRGGLSDALVLHLDLAPTFTALAGAADPPGANGRSLVPLLQDPDGEWREDFLIEHFGVSTFSAASEGVRSRRWKYIETPGGGGEVELYDLEADPFELRNRAGDPALSEIEARLARRLRELLKE